MSLLLILLAINIANEIAGFTWEPDILPIKNTTNASAPPTINGLPPLQKTAKIKKNAPRYSAIYALYFIFYYTLDKIIYPRPEVMCWSAEVSLNSFVIGLIAIYVGYKMGIPVKSLLFYSTIVLMQLIEYVVWTHGLTNTDRSAAVNYTASLAASYLLAMQPIAAILSQSTKNTAITTNLLCVYIIIAAIYVLYRSNNPPEYKMEKGSDGHLVWKWIGHDYTTYIGLTIYFVFLFAPFILTKKVDGVFAVVLLTLLGSLYSYWRAGTWGSMWCWMINLVVIVVSMEVLFT
jgi:hypothetical protein